VGGDAEFIVDTGFTGEISLSTETLQSAGLFEAANRGQQVKHVGIGGVTVEKQFTLDWIEAAGKRYPYIRASTGWRSQYNLVGSGWLSQFRVTFDFRRQLLWLE